MSFSIRPYASTRDSSSSQLPIYNASRLNNSSLGSLSAIDDGDVLTWDEDNLEWVNAPVSSSSCDASGNVVVGPSPTVSGGAQNTVVGCSAGGNPLTSQDCVVVGYAAGALSTTDDRVCVGSQAGYASQLSGSVAVGTISGYQSQGANAVAIGYAAGWTEQSVSAVAIGFNAGYSSQGDGSVTVGAQSGSQSQGDNAVAIGYSAGTSQQSDGAIAIGFHAGNSSQLENAIAIGANAGYSWSTITQMEATVTVGAYPDSAVQSNQHGGAVAIGYLSGQNQQKVGCVAIGYQAGSKSQGQLLNVDPPGGRAVAIGYQSGYSIQQEYAIAIGSTAGYSFQGADGIAIGREAGQSAQATNGIALGRSAGQYSQGFDTSNPLGAAIAIGNEAGKFNQQPDSIAIGHYTGKSSLGRNSIAIGHNAGIYDGGSINQPANTISLNATGQTMPNGSGYPITNACYLAPVRNIGNTSASSAVCYNNTTKEVFYGTKTFVIPHPQLGKSDRYLVHGCLEGPEVGVYYRGEGTIAGHDDGETEITLPDYVDSLAYDFTASVTPIGKGQRQIPHSVSRVSQGVFRVYGDVGDFFWLVHGCRNELEVEPLCADTEVRGGDGPYKWIA